jgi:hemerythrin-like domain-containing protein
MKPTDVLKDEHQAILLTLRILDKISADLAAGRPVPTDHLDQIVDFIRTFADRCHHGKEEDLLFTAMEEAGVPRQGGPIGVMLHEHEIGRNYVRGLAAALTAYRAGEPGAVSKIIENARGYSSLLAQHIAKEDNILYPIADAHLSPEKQAELLELFERVEQERIGPGRHEAYHAMLHDLQQTYLS